MGQYKITKPIRLIELFAGIGTQAMALRDLGADFVRWRAVECDRLAVKSYNAIWQDNIKPIDIREVSGEWLCITDTDKYEYIMSVTAPCTNISRAGKKNGMVEGSGTRSSTLWEVKRILNELKILPQIIFFENVVQIHGKKNAQHFQEWLDFLNKKGQKNYWEDLNAKDYGIPQERNRTFIISILNSTDDYSFPKPIKLTTCMADYLEEDVDEKYLLNNEKADALINVVKNNGRLEKEFQENKEILKKEDRIGNIYNATGGNYAGMVYGKYALCPTIRTASGGNGQPLIVVKN